ncbi:MAG: DUF748 domain-containing protein [Limisphaerales bacterium]
MIRRLFRWALYLFIIFVVLVVAAILLLDTIAREIAQNRIRAETGMGVKIGKLSIGLLSPTVTIENFKMYNTAEFGGSQCLDIPELHVEYDVQAARAGKLHLRLVRFNMAEVDVLQDKKGHTNFDQLQKRNAAVLSGKPATSKPGTSTLRAPFEFTGIDTLNLTLQKVHFATVETPRQERDVNFGITNQIFHNIKNEGDLMGLAAVISLRMGALNGGSGGPFDGALKQLLH